MPSKLFPTGGPVSEEDLVDREDFLSSLYQRLSDGQSVMLAGPRRIGKTSLAYTVLRQLKRQGFYVATVDLFRLSSKKEFATALINACLENRTGLQKTLSALKSRTRTVAGTAKLIVKLQDLEISLGLFEKESDEDIFDYTLSLPGLLAERDGVSVVVLFDEFQEAGRILGDDVYKRMRSHFQTQEGVSYLFLGSKESMMKTLFGEHRQAFYRFATILPIPPVPEEAWVEYIARKFAGRGVMANDKAVREIVRLTGGHPQDMMTVCSESYYALLETGDKILTIDFVRLGYDRALLTLAPVFDEILDELGQRTMVRKVLLQIARGEKIFNKDVHPNSLMRALKHLIAKGILEKKGRGNYSFTEPMLQEYILREERF